MNILKTYGAVFFPIIAISLGLITFSCGKSAPLKGRWIVESGPYQGNYIEFQGSNIRIISRDSDSSEILEGELKYIGNSAFQSLFPAEDTSSFLLASAMPDSVKSINKLWYGRSFNVVLNAKDKTKNSVVGPVFKFINPNNDSTNAVKVLFLIDKGTRSQDTSIVPEVMRLTKLN